MNTPTTLSAFRSFAFALAFSGATFGTFGCASALEAADPSGDLSATPSPARPAMPVTGDACAHTTPGIYTNEDTGPGPRVGGECHYDEVRGYVVVTSIEDAPADEYNCSIRPQKIAVTFYDSNGNALATDTLRNAYGANAPLGCLEREGIRVGAHLPATRAVITSGTCSPVVLRVTEELSICDAECF